MIFTPALSYSDTDRLRPRTAAGRRPVASRKRGVTAPAYRNFTLRGDKSFADDLTVGQGAVSSRVALLLRSAEANPSLPRFVEKPPLPRRERRPLTCEPPAGERMAGKKKRTRRAAAPPKKKLGGAARRGRAVPPAQR